MKRGGVLLLCLCCSLIMSAAFVFADEVAQNLESRVIESFDLDSGRTWVVVGSKFATSGFPKSGMVKAWPEALFWNPRENKDSFRSLGIQGQFDRKGYNTIEIIPAAADGNGGYTVDPIVLPGRVRTLDLWAWGSNHDFYLEAHLRDHRGIVHVMKLGDLRHIGWKKLQASVPPQIVQSVKYAPRLKPLELIKLVIWTRPTERVEDFYVYLDHLMVYTDVFESRYDGDYMAMPEIIEEIWAGVE